MNDFLLYLRQRLTPPRLQHSQGVMRVMADLADILAPVDVWDGIQKLKSLVYAGRLEEACLLHCGWSIDYFQEIGVPLHPNLQREYAVLSTRLAVSDIFFDRKSIR